MKFCPTEAIFHNFTDYIINRILKRDTINIT